MPGFINVMVGTLEDPESVTPEVAVFVRSRRSWDCADPAVAAFDVQPGWVPKT
jgi:hypothetical protein